MVKQRKHAPMFVVDLAVPRDVEPEAAELDDVFLYSDRRPCRDRQATTSQVRREAVVQAEQMIADQSAISCAGSEGRTIVPDHRRAAWPSRRAALGGTRACAQDARSRRIAGAGA